MKTILNNLVSKIKTNDGYSHESIYDNIDYETTIQINKQVESDGYWLDVDFEVEIMVDLFGMRNQELNYVDYKVWKDGDEVTLNDENSDYLFELLQKRRW
jgi:hypothetical protein